MLDNGTSPRKLNFKAAQQSQRKRRAAAECGNEWACSCGETDFQVERTVQEYNGIYRKRICKSCGTIIETHERIINIQK